MTTDDRDCANPARPLYIATCENAAGETLATRVMPLDAGYQEALGAALGLVDRHADRGARYPLVWTSDNWVSACIDGRVRSPQ